MRSENLETRLQIRSTIAQILNELMYNNQISATDMEEALEHYLIGLKDNVLLEYAESAIQEKAIIQEQLNKLTKEGENEEE